MSKFIIVVLKIILLCGSPMVKGQDEGGIQVNPQKNPAASNSQILKKIENNSNEIKNLIVSINETIREIKTLENDIDKLIANKEKNIYCSTVLKFRDSKTKLKKNLQSLNEQQQTTEIKQKLIEIKQDLSRHEAAEKNFLDYLKKENLSDCAQFDSN